MICSRTHTFRNSRIAQIRLFVLWGLGEVLERPFWNSRLDREFLGEHAVDRGAADAIVPCDLAETLSALPVAEDSLAIQFQRRPAQLAALEPGAPHAGAHPLDDQRTFQFRDGADDDDDGAAQRAARVNLFAEADELDLQVIQLIQHLQEVGHRPGDAVEGPDQDHIEPAAAGIAQQLVQTGPPGLGAGYLVGVFLRDREAALGGELPEVQQLRLGVLVDRADSEVESGALHGIFEGSISI